jgi:hypothetical protein
MSWKLRLKNCTNNIEIKCEYANEKRYLFTLVDKWKKTKTKKWNLFWFRLLNFSRKKTVSQISFFFHQPNRVENWFCCKNYSFLIALYIYKSIRQSFKAQMKEPKKIQHWYFDIIISFEFLIIFCRLISIYGESIPKCRLVKWILRYGVARVHNWNWFNFLLSWKVKELD